MEIMDHNQKEESSGDHHGNEEEIVNHKSCVDCKTTKTPLWRSGPAGPKSLCNACGIRHRKKKNNMLGLNKESSTKKQQKITKKNGVDKTSGEEKRISKSLRVKFINISKEVVLLQRQRSPLKRGRESKLGEVEEAALLLMALSCGYA